MRLPIGWADATLDELTVASSPICYGVLKPGDPNPGGVRMVRVTDIRTNELVDTELMTISDALDNEFSRSRILAGDVLISVQGTVGRVAVAPKSLTNANISRTIARIRPVDAVEPYWLWRALRAPQFQSAAADQTAGTTRDSLNIGTLRQLKVPLPPLAEQRRIVAKLDTVGGKIARARLELNKVAKLGGPSKGIALLDRLESAILAKAFRGELVPQDQEDDPASVLLERIRAQRAGAPRAKRGRTAGANAA